MSVFEYDTRDGAIFRFGRSGENAYVEDDTGQRYVFVRDQEADLADFFAERVKPAHDEPEQYPRVQGICPSCGVGPLFRAEEGLITCSWVDCKEPDAAANLLADPPQPDRPEPVDPASVKVGDVVTVEADDGSWTVRGEVDSVHPGSSYPFRVHVPHMHAGGIWPRLGPSNIRILQRPEPEPDEAAVEALRRVWKESLAAMDCGGQEPSGELLRGMVRRNVRVVNTDA